MTYKKILVALDGSPQTEAVFEKALELACNNEANLMLFHCLPYENPEVASYSDLYGQNLANFSQIVQEQITEQMEKIRKWLAAYGDRATHADVTTVWDWKVGDAGKWISSTARDWAADLVVVGRRGRRGITEILLGSVSNYVLHHAPCSVLIVQGDSPQPFSES